MTTAPADRQMDPQAAERAYRDERRAWYDTLRDLVPIVHGFLPTVRLHGGELEWCALDAGQPSDIARFRWLLCTKGQKLD